MSGGDFHHLWKATYSPLHIPNLSAVIAVKEDCDKV